MKKVLNIQKDKRLYSGRMWGPTARRLSLTGSDLYVQKRGKKETFYFDKWTVKFTLVHEYIIVDRETAKRFLSKRIEGSLREQPTTDDDRIIGEYFPEFIEGTA